MLPPDFTGVQQPIDEAPEISVPVALLPQLEPPAPTAPGSTPQPPRLAQPTYWWLQVMGRLKPGATAEQVHGNLGDGAFSTPRAPVWLST